MKTLLAVVALVAAAPASAAVTERFRIADSLHTVDYPQTLVVVLASPEGFRRDYVGSWRGPRYASTTSPTFGGTAVLDWSIVTYKAPAAGATFLKNRAHGWAVHVTGVERVERRVGGRAVGSLRAQWVLTRPSNLPSEARYEAGLVLPLCGRAAVVRLALLLPGSNNGHGVGDAVIEGMPPSEWNRLQILDTFARARLEGNLPAARVAAARRGRAVAGRVTDCNGHPLAAAQVTLERRQGRGWVRVRAGRTAAAGTYSLVAPGSGAYRVVAGGRSSAPVRMHSA
jgi:hypothetical protein